MTRLLLGLFFFVPFSAFADELFAVDAARSHVDYTLIHKFHTVRAVAKKGIEAKAKIGAEGAQLMIRIPVQSFDSGNGNRDEHMLETVEAAKFPFVELKAVAADGKAQASKATLKGKLTFHGVTQDVEIPVDLKWASGKDVGVTGKFSISLEGYKVDRPSLMGIRVDDKVDIEVDLHMTQS